MTWQSSTTARTTDIRGRVFAADGTPVDGSDFLVSTANASDQDQPADHGAGEWRLRGDVASFDNGSNFDIRGRVFAADGTPVDGSDFLVSTANTNDQINPQITALANGGFAVTWASVDNGAN